MASARRVVIIGGGFGGLQAALTLGMTRLDVTLVDRRNHHLFQPLLYQVATAALNPSDIASPIRGIVRRLPNVRVIMGEVVAIDRERRAVQLSDMSLPYDFLLVATGATHSYFGHDDWERFAPGLKTLEDALDIRRRTLIAYEQAERLQPGDPAIGAWLTFVIVGGGPTGVEMAGALAEVSRHILAKDFRNLAPRSSQVLLLEAGPRILPSMQESLAAEAVRELAQLGAQVRTGAKVTRIDAEGVDIGGERIQSKTVVWAAGVAASALGRDLGGPLDRAGRVLVEADLSVPGHPEIFVAGDLASLQQDGAPIPGVAPAAMQQGRHAAANILRRADGQPTLPFRYWDRGTLATIGRSRAVGKIFGRPVSGLLAWMAWLTIHLIYLVGFRSRLLVLIQWAWTYLTYQRGARLIQGGSGLPGPPSPPGAPKAASAERAQLPRA